MLYVKRYWPMVVGVIDLAKRYRHHEEVTTLQDVIEAFNAIEEAERRYREVLRTALAGGVRQAEIAKALNRTREAVRQDAMTDEQREEIRRKVAERMRVRRLRKSAEK